VPGRLQFPSHASELGYGGEINLGDRIDGDVVAFDVRVPADCIDACGKAYFWALSAFASGPWARSPA
jgi:hypothetical protein